MPTYQYRAKDRAGKTVTGSLDAEDERATADALRDMGLWPMNIETFGRPNLPTPAPGCTAPTQIKRTGAPTATQTGSVPVIAEGKWNAPGVPLKDLAIFFRQLAAAVHSGMPLGRCMEIMREQSRGTLMKVSAEAAEAVHRGQPLSVSFAHHPRLFSSLILATIRAGEVGGQLDNALNRIAEMLERQYELNQRIRQQTFMPKLTLAMAVVISIVVKLVTRAIGGDGAALGAGFGSVIVPAVGAIASLYFIAVIISRIGVRSRFIDQLKLSLPIFGKVTRTVALARFSRGFASLYRAGVPVPEALDTAANASGNQVFAERLQAAVPAVQRGERLVDALMPTQVLPLMALNMLRTGEETGNVDDMLDKVADYAEAEAETAAKNMATMAGPLLLLFVGVLVGVEVVRFFMRYVGMLGGVM